MIGKILRNIWQYLPAVLVSLALALLLRLFIFDFYSIPTNSMTPALKAGDFILVNKLCPGPRFYRNFNFLSTGKEPEIFRLKGLSIARNDVVVFNIPYTHGWDTVRMSPDLFYVKRCIGLPGDTLRIVGGFYEVNGLRGFGNLEEQKALASEEPHEAISGTFPYDPAYPWTIKEFGPLLIPGKGTSIEINAANLCLYRKLIAYETGGRIVGRKGRVYLNGEELARYTFTHNWYFMAGDNVMSSQDCRYLGPVPEEHIVGKASRVIWSRDPDDGSLRWKRVMTGIKQTI